MARDAGIVVDLNKLIARYLKLSGGDNGLSDYDIFDQNHNGEFYGGGRAKRSVQDPRP